MRKSVNTVGSRYYPDLNEASTFNKCWKQSDKTSFAILEKAISSDWLKDGFL